MKVTVFAKKGTSREGKKFDRYIGRISRKNGDEITVAVKFREDAGTPKAADCPMNIIVAKEDANLAAREYVREDTGEVATSYTLWVSKWTPGEAYVDHSLDDFED